MPSPLDKGQHRRSVVRCYLTPEQKADVARMAKAVELTQSDLVRLLLVTVTPEDAEHLKLHPAYLTMLEEEKNR